MSILPVPDVQRVHLSGIALRPSDLWSSTLGAVSKTCYSARRHATLRGVMNEMFDLRLVRETSHFRRAVALAFDVKVRKDKLIIDGPSNEQQQDDNGHRYKQSPHSTTSEEQRYTCIPQKSRRSRRR